MNKKKLKNNKFFKSFWPKERVLMALSLFLFFFSLLGIYYFLFLPDFLLLDNDNKEEFRQEEEIIEEDDCFNCRPRFLDGILVEADRARLYPVALILDNEPKFRPPNGLAQAALVYEAPTEGGSSRFLAFYNGDEDIAKLGPIRSARPYFIDWALDASALLVHCGGSPESLAKLAQERISSLNEFYFGDYFWREENLPAPHNIMIKSQAWQKFLNNYGLRETQAASWLFKESDDLIEETIIEDEEILVYYSKNYQASWHYQREGNYYQRRVNGEIQLDNEEEIKAKNLILHYSVSQVLDELFRLKIDTIGQGRAIICQNAYCQEGSWRKNGVLERLRYFDNDNQEIIFNPGPTWISVMAAGAKTSF